MPLISPDASTTMSCYLVDKSLVELRGTAFGDILWDKVLENEALRAQPQKLSSLLSDKQSYLQYGAYIFTT